MDRVRQRIAVGCSGAVGALLAVLSDMIQKEEASAVLKITDIGTRLLELPLPPVAFAAFLILIGVALVFIFNSDTSKKSFYVGASIITILMTLVPFKLPVDGSVSLERAAVKVAQASSWLVPAGYAEEAVPPNCQKGIGKLDIFLRSADGGTLQTVLVEVAQYYSDNDQKILRKFWVNESEKRLSLNTKLGYFVVRITSGSRDLVQREVKIGCTNVAKINATLVPAGGLNVINRLFTPYQIPRK